VREAPRVSASTRAALGRAAARAIAPAPEPIAKGPRASWPAMRLDRPLSVGARGGHGPIRYEVTEYEPGRSVVFRFRAPRGFVGTHTFEIAETGVDGRSATLRHVVQMDLEGPARLAWPLVYRWLHDALVEDALDNAERLTTGAVESPAVWSRRVRVLRRVLGRARRA
jgi:hypothetical protein